MHATSVCDGLGNYRHSESVTDESEGEIHLAGTKGDITIDPGGEKKFRDNSFQSQARYKSSQLRH